MRRLLLLLTLVGIIALLAHGCSSLERTLLYHPTHNPPQPPLEPWVVDGQQIGFARPVADPQTVWLLFHGNGGQAFQRSYALDHFSPLDAVYVLEYPGYGERPGTPSRKSIDRAAGSAYRHLRASFPDTPVCVASESIGSGPACALAELPEPPDKIVLVAPFDHLSNVAETHFPPLLVKLFLRSDWNNAEAIAGYTGPVEIFAAQDDTIIPPDHAHALADSHQNAKFTLIDGGHNDWSLDARVRFRYP